MTIEQPVIIVGAGRSGSTLFHDLLAEHPRMAWISALTNRDPDRPARNRWVLNNLKTPVLGAKLQERAGPVECYKLWDKHYPGFSTPCRDLVAGDATPKSVRRLREAFEQTTTAKRDRLLLKVTGWPRTGFLNEVWSDAKFIHVVRDGRPVANSLMGVDWWWGWRGPENWRWGPLPKDQAKLWEKHDRSFVALAGIQWNILMASTVAALKRLPRERVMEVRYETLCDDPVAAFDEVLPFCGLDADAGFTRAMRDAEIKPANDKWRRGLTEEQQAILDDVTAEWRDHFGYP